MFASNFPVDSLVGSFETIFFGLLAITSTFPGADARRYVSPKRCALYRISRET